MMQIVVLNCLRSLMDRMSACEAVDPGSIPGGGTKEKAAPKAPLFLLFY